MLDHILDEAENSDGSGPLEVTVNETWLTNDIIEGFTDGESPITFLRNTLHEWIPDRIDAVADGEAFNITFENREEAVTFVTGVKQELADMQEIDVFDTLSDYAWAALIFT